MSIWPLPGVTGEMLSQQLAHVIDDAANVAGRGGTADEVLRNYLTWASESYRMLNQVMRPADIRRLVLTERYWATLSTNVEPKLIQSTLLEEARYRATALEREKTELDRYMTMWRTDRVHSAEVAYVVPDTNLFLHHPQTYRDLDWHDLLRNTVRSMANIRVVVPILIIEELDNHKRDQTRTRARLALKSIYDDFATSIEGSRTFAPAQELKGEVSMQILLDPVDHVRLPSADQELVDRALALQSLLGHPVDFVSYDTAACFRAMSAGLRHHRLEMP